MSESDHISTIEKKVNVLLAENKVSAVKLCENIGMTANGYSKMWKNRSLKVETIQKIANFFEVPLPHFFPSLNRAVEGSYNFEDEASEVNEFREKYIQALESENKLLKKLLEKKDNN